MAKTKLTKSAVEAAQPQAPGHAGARLPVQDYPARRKVFMLQYRTNAGERRASPPWVLYGELTVEQTCSLAQEWLAEVRRGGGPRRWPAPRLRSRNCARNSWRNTPPSATSPVPSSYQGVVDRCIVPILGQMKVQDVKRLDVAGAMKKMAHKPAEANRAFSVMRKMLNMTEV